MALKSQDQPLQNGVAFMAEGKAGAVKRSPSSSVRTYEYGTNMVEGTTIGFGGAVVLDTDGGVRLPMAGDTVAKIQGFATYENTGIIEYNGYKKGGLFYNVSVCEFGEMLLPVKTGETLVVGDDLALYIGSGTDYNTVEKLPLAPGANDITLVGKVRVARPSIGGLVTVTLIKYSN
jgi:hypothetical protein